MDKISLKTSTKNHFTSGNFYTIPLKMLIAALPCEENPIFVVPMKTAITFSLILISWVLLGQTQSSYKLAVLKYNGGGDYYANPTALPNLVQFCNQNIGTQIAKEVPYVDAGSKDIFLYPFVHMTGHGNVVFSRAEVSNLRTYLLGGGFLHID